jgi:hypothetical protein
MDRACSCRHRPGRDGSIAAGSAKEGGTLKVTGGDRFELIQEYREFKRPGGSVVEEVEDAPTRGFTVLALTPSALVLRLANTTYFDEEAGRQVSVQPDGDYFLVWRKEGAATSSTVARRVVEVRRNVIHGRSAAFCRHSRGASTPVATAPLHTHRYRCIL